MLFHWQQVHPIFLQESKPVKFVHLIKTYFDSMILSLSVTDRPQITVPDEEIVHKFPDNQNDNSDLNHRTMLGDHNTGPNEPAMTPHMILLSLMTLYWLKIITPT